MTNTIGTVFGAYPATGSFSRSALKSKSGVRTPAAGILTAIVVIVALYGLTPAFFWIPSAGLSAIIIHAVADLVAKPTQVYSFWRVSPLEFLIWAAAVLVTVFSTIENGIYTSICTSLALLLVRVARPRGYFLGKITLRSPQTGSSDARDVYVPLNPKASLMNDTVKVTPPPPGIIVYRFEESFVYPNSSILNSTIVDHVKANMRRGKNMALVKLHDRPWNDPGPRPGHDESAENDKKPDLHAIVLDFSGVYVFLSQINSSVEWKLRVCQTVVHKQTPPPSKHSSTRATKSSDGQTIPLRQAQIYVTAYRNRTDSIHQFHFATILSPWIRRALIAGGFGGGSPSSSFPTEIAQVVPYGDVSGPSSELEPEKPDLEHYGNEIHVTPVAGSASGLPAAPIGVENTPFFHFDVVSAVRAAETGLHRTASSSASVASTGKQPIRG